MDGMRQKEALFDFDLIAMNLLGPRQDNWGGTWKKNQWLE
jgi:hypothetical protein